MSSRGTTGQRELIPKESQYRVERDRIVSKETQYTIFISRKLDAILCVSGGFQMGDAKVVCV